jgi:hypothetical protein
VVDCVALSPQRAGPDLAPQPPVPEVGATALDELHHGGNGVGVVRRSGETGVAVRICDGSSDLNVVTEDLVACDAGRDLSGDGGVGGRAPAEIDL